MQYRERVIFIGQHIDEEFSNQVLATMLYLDSIESSKKLYLYINGPGGDVSNLDTSLHLPNVHLFAICLHSRLLLREELRKISIFSRKMAKVNDDWCDYITALSSLDDLFGGSFFC